MKIKSKKLENFSNMPRVLFRTCRTWIWTLTLEHTGQTVWQLQKLSLCACHSWSWQIECRNSHTPTKMWKIPPQIEIDCKKKKGKRWIQSNSWRSKQYAAEIHLNEMCWFIFSLSFQFIMSYSPCYCSMWPLCDPTHT